MNTEEKGPVLFSLKVGPLIYRLTMEFLKIFYFSITSALWNKPCNNIIIASKFNLPISICSRCVLSMICWLAICRDFFPQTVQKYHHIRSPLSFAGFLKARFPSARPWALSNEKLFCTFFSGVMGGNHEVTSSAMAQRQLNPHPKQLQLPSLPTPTPFAGKQDESQEKNNSGLSARMWLLQPGGGEDKLRWCEGQLHAAFQPLPLLSLREALS